MTLWLSNDLCSLRLHHPSSILMVENNLCFIAIPNLVLLASNIQNAKCFEDDIFMKIVELHLYYNKIMEHFWGHRS
jgi:hypothetical protein